MKMKEETIQFESMSARDSEKLTGGFSDVYNFFVANDSVPIPNNCNGGNYEKGCGSKNKGNQPDDTSKSAPNGNCGAGKNCVKGCGEKL